MYDKEKIMKVMGEINEESKQIKPYVIICCPRRDKNEIPAQKLNEYHGLHIDFSGYSRAYIEIDGEKVDVARNYLMDAAIESGAKYMLFIGEDTVMPYNGFLNLHKTAEENPNSVVVGVYYIKLSSQMIMIKEGDHIIPGNVDPGQVFEAWQTGLDAALIPIKILKEMKEKEPEIPFCCIGYNLPNLPFIGEDNFFVHRLRKEGYKLLVNTDVQCLHIDLKLKKYTAHPSITDEKIKTDYFTNFPIEGKLTMNDKKEIDLRWTNRLPKKEEINENIK